MQHVVYDKNSGMRVPVKVWTKDYERSALEQAMNVARLPFIHSHVALMPDTHFGYGVPIGSVVPCDGYVIPNAVGVDIGCGMCAVNTRIHLGDFSDSDIDTLFNTLKTRIPVGSNWHKSDEYTALRFDETANELADIFGRYDPVGKKPIDENSLVRMSGTLGDGNHFVELQIDEHKNIWIMIHSGSRAFGASIADHYHRLAKRMCELYHSDLPTLDLAYLPVNSEEGQGYIQAMNLALEFAYLNRRVMMLNVLEVLRSMIHGAPMMDEMINIHHNYAAIENHRGKNVWVHRKGATSARENQIGIIPGSMCTKSYIVRGKGDGHSFMSCSHGSGRNFSRKEAKRRIDDGIDPSQEDQLNGVKVFGASDVRDEVSSAYKNVEDVMGYQTDLVEILHELRPLAVLKG